jgi:hypothetical protein
MLSILKGEGFCFRTRLALVLTGHIRRDGQSLSSSLFSPLAATVVSIIIIIIIIIVILFYLLTVDSSTTRPCVLRMECHHWLISAHL